MRDSPIRRATRLAAAFSLTACASLAAQTPLGTAFTYQGRLETGGAAADGLYDFQTCLFDSPTSPIPLACAPDHDDVPVEDGVFTLTLDFGAGAFTGQARHLELRVRSGAGAGGYAQLSPRQLVRPAPEALRASVASAAPWSGLTGVPAGFADGVDADSGGTVTSVSAGVGLAGGTITATGTLAVDTTAIQARVAGNCTVGRYVRQINADGTVVCGDDADAGGTVTAVTAGAGLTGGTIATSGTLAVDFATVQARVAASCANGYLLRGIAADGTPLCTLQPIRFERRLAATGLTGAHTSLELRSDGRPAITYHNASLADLVLLDCADETCSSATERTLDATNAGEYSSLALRAGGRPVVSYYARGGGDLKLYLCNDAACTSGVVRTLDGSGNTGLYTSLALRADGRPVVSYHTSPSGLYLYDCADIECTSGSVRTLDVAGLVGLHGAIALRPDGRPIVSHYDDGNDDLKVFDCADAACTSGTSRTVDDGFGTSVGEYTSIAMRPDGRALIAYTSSSEGQIRVFDCPNPACGPGGTSWGVVGSGQLDQFRYTSIALNAENLPVVAFREIPTGDLKLYVATGGFLSGHLRTLDASANVGSYPSLALRADGRVIVSHHDSDLGDLKLSLCGTALCD